LPVVARFFAHRGESQVLVRFHRTACGPSPRCARRRSSRVSFGCGFAAWYGTAAGEGLSVVWLALLSASGSPAVRQQRAVAARRLVGRRRVRRMRSAARADQRLIRTAATPGTDSTARPFQGRSRAGGLWGLTASPADSTSANGKGRSTGPSRGLMRIR